MASVKKYRVYCQTESTYVYGWYESEPTNCPNNNGHSILGTATTIVDILDTVGNFDSSGRLKVNSGGYTQFGEQRVSMYKTLFQNYALYNIINNQMYTLLTGTGGTITGNVNGTELDISITNAIGSYAVLRSSKVCKYRPGYNLVLRWNCVYDTPVANLFQFGGLGNNGSDIYFCYNGLNFGVRYSTGGYAEVRRLAITVETSTPDPRTATVILNGVSFSVPIKPGGDAHFTASQIARFTYPGWLVLSVDSTVIFTAQDVGLKNGTYSYSSNGNSTGVFTTRRNGSSLNTTFINRSDWNGSSSMVQALDPLKRNMYSINYTWYGSGNMTFQVFNSESSSYETVHTIVFSNLYTEPSLTQPNMYLQQGIASLGSTVSKTIRAAGGFGAVEGNYSIDYPIYGIDNSKSIASGIETIILAIRSRNSIGGFTNNSETLMKKLSINCEGTKSVRIRIIKNPTTLSANTSSDYNRWRFISESQSITIYDTTSNTFTGDSQVLATYYLSKSGSQVIDLDDKEFLLFKSDVVIVTAMSLNSSDVDCAITIVEDY